MKFRFFMSLALILCILCAPAAQAAEKKDGVLYDGIITRRYPNSYTNVYDRMDSDTGKVIKTMNAGNKIQILDV